MASQVNKQQEPDVKQTEVQVQQDQERLMAQMNQQEQATASGNLQATVAATTASGQVQLHSAGAAAAQMTLGLVNAFFVDPTKQMASALNPLKGMQYATYHPGFIPNIGGAIFQHDADAINQVQNSIAMLPARLTSLGATGAGVWGIEHLGLGGLAGKGLSTVLQGFGMGGRLAGLAGGATSFGLYTLALDIANYMAQGTVDIGGFTKMADYIGNKYIGRLSSTNVNGIGYTPTQATDFGIDLYKMSKESGYGIRGLGGETFSEGEVEKVVSQADQAGILRDAASVTEMRNKISNLLRAYKSVAKELHLTAEGGLSLSAGLMNLGFGTAESVMGAAREVKTVAESTGQSYREALYSGSSMAEKFLTGGLGQTGGMTYGLQSNLFQSYLYQTHQARYMPEGLGGYNAALMINQAGQMGMVNNPLFQNALTIASYGGGYNKGLMNKAIEMNPLVTSIYAKALLGNNPNKIYANVWNSGNNATQALSDPTMQARMIAGDLRRARIDMNNDAAVKGYLYNYYRRSGISAGQARYAADNMYAQVKNIDNMEMLENKDLLGEQNINVSLLSTILRPENIATFKYWTGGAFHQLSTGIGESVNRFGAKVGENVGRTLMGWRHESVYSPVAHAEDYAAINTEAMRMSGIDMENRYITPYDSNALGFVMNYRRYLQNPGEELTRKEKLNVSTRLMENPELRKLYTHIRQNLYNPEFAAESANTAANAWGVIPKFLYGGARMAFSNGEYQPDLGEIFSPWYKIMHGVTGNAINPDVIPDINKAINLIARHKVAPGSSEWGNYLSQLVPLSPKDIERTRRLAAGKVSDVFQADAKRLESMSHEYDRSAQHTLKAYIFDRVTKGTLGGADERVRKDIKKIGGDKFARAYGYIELAKKADANGRKNLAEEYRNQAHGFLTTEGKLSEAQANEVLNYMTNNSLLELSKKGEMMLAETVYEKHKGDADGGYSKDALDTIARWHSSEYYKLATGKAIVEGARKGIKTKEGMELGSEYSLAGTGLGEVQTLLNRYDLDYLRKDKDKQDVITSAIKSSGSATLLNDWNLALTGNQEAFTKLRTDIASAGGKTMPTTVQLRTESDVFASMNTLVEKTGKLVIMMDNLLTKHPELAQ